MKIIFAITLLAFAAFAKDKEPAKPTPLTEAQKVEYLQSVQKTLAAKLAIPELKEQYERRTQELTRGAEDAQKDTAKVTEGLRKATGAPSTCGLNEKQEWVMVKGQELAPCVIETPKK